MNTLTPGALVNILEVCSRCVDVCAPCPYPNQAARKEDVKLPGEGNSNCHGARPVHLIIAVIKWIRTSRLSIKNIEVQGGNEERVLPQRAPAHARYTF